MKLKQNILDVLEKIEAGENPNELSEGDDTIAKTINEVSCGDGFGYGLYEGGYIRPESFYEGDDLQKMKDAIALVGEMKKVWEKISIEF